MTGKFWLGLILGDIVASITILFVLALLHAGKRSDQTGPEASPDSARSGSWRGPASPSRDRADDLDRWHL